jgi:hypothetical protein
MLQQEVTMQDYRLQWVCCSIDLTLTFMTRVIGMTKLTIGKNTMDEKFGLSTTIRVLSVLAFTVWIIQSPYSGWWVSLAILIAGL